MLCSDTHVRAHRSNVLCKVMCQAAAVSARRCRYRMLQLLRELGVTPLPAHGWAGYNALAYAIAGKADIVKCVDMLAVLLCV